MTVTLAIKDAIVAPRHAGEPLGIIAGGGDLPRLVAEQARLHGWTPKILAVGDGIGESWLPEDAWPMAWGRLGDAFAYLKGRSVRRLVLCGTVSVRPDFRSILPSLRTLAMLPQIFRVIRGGDDNLLRAAARAFEQRGFELVAVQEILPELLMPPGGVSCGAPGQDDRAALRRGFQAAGVLGALDVGQAVVASKDRVIALEGIEGTREMLQRVADLRRRGRIGSAEHCVLVKGVKPGQDLRFDLPSIGVSTIEEAAEAGLVGIGLSAGHALVIGLDDVTAAARARRIFLWGWTDADSARTGP
ncbi:hypothetical protein Sa4125_22450 [Aureimonas sp. SA4125]|uniref:LpxI family protein n=1 Tax=Aureimonas sp. SA4125 TaxID=2826993 RepID=UPI001CC74841|nr:UDP-2,3-diacylglucosamine diphosphatase LpxI [Aureimonas sp. SA4125]BDA84703.1 hypothetical protein Sa4125_22450 [Aureimonas sp. SA4125]